MDGWREGQADTGTHYTNSSITASKEEVEGKKTEEGIGNGRVQEAPLLVCRGRLMCPVATLQGMAHQMVMGDSQEEEKDQEEEEVVVVVVVVVEDRRKKDR
ncbi:hypothetical protein E2C01_071142 [Portunus trituberculatus]|uniref:Uncharacterized protein n=1 Tax=Portunus trituberculatus TaxID=210409 RepID=A0A5B7I418_PORTR|nr:hypothetical protein [Portunus trituberculatus]